MLLRRRTLRFARGLSEVGAWLFVVAVFLIAAAVTFRSVKPVDLLAGLGFFSVAVGFAFQDILENTLAGMLLLFRQPFRSGDQIDVVGTSGTVEEITIRETRINTYDGELVIIPNRDVYKNIITVHTHEALPYSVRRHGRVLVPWLEASDPDGVPPPGKPYPKGRLFGMVCAAPHAARREARPAVCGARDGRRRATSASVHCCCAAERSSSDSTMERSGCSS